MIYPHTITVWTKHTEGRAAYWKKAVHVQAARFEPTYGATASISGDDTARTADLITRGSKQLVKRGDKVLPGYHRETEPPAGAFTVQTVSPLSLNGAICHWEAELA